MLTARGFFDSTDTAEAAAGRTNIDAVAALLKERGSIPTLSRAMTVLLLIDAASNAAVNAEVDAAERNKMAGVAVAVTVAVVGSTAIPAPVLRPSVIMTLDGDVTDESEGDCAGL